MNKQINIGVLGCAGIAFKSVIPNIIELSEIYNLSGIASREKTKADSYGDHFNTTPFYSYESILQDGNLDAIYIPLPNSLHAEWIEKALNKNIHVLVEKSLACNFEEVVKLNELAKDKKLALVENFQFRFHKQLAEIKNIIQSGMIGELRSIRSSFGFPPFTDIDNIRYKKELGGGALLDAGAYPIKISQILLGNDLEIKAATLFQDSIKDVDIWGGGFIKNKTTTIFAEIAFGFDNYYQCNIEVWGSKGKLSTNRIFTAPSNFEAEILVETQVEKLNIKVTADNHFRNILLHFYDLISGKKSLEDEYVQNITQARLINEFKNKANE